MRSIVKFSNGRSAGENARTASRKDTAMKIYDEMKNVHPSGQGYNYIGSEYWIEAPRKSILEHISSLPVGSTITHNQLFARYKESRGSNPNPNIRQASDRGLHDAIEDVLHDLSYDPHVTEDEYQFVKIYGGRDPRDPEGKILRNNHDWGTKDGYPDYNGTYTKIA
jgi:hypothetical protein